jgi:hypothetical protein
MDMTTMSAGMAIACVSFGLLLIAFLVVGIAAGIKYLRSPRQPGAVSDTQQVSETQHISPMGHRAA